MPPVCKFKQPITAFASTEAAKTLSCTGSLIWSTRSAIEVSFSWYRSESSGVGWLSKSYGRVPGVPCRAPGACTVMGGNFFVLMLRRYHEAEALSAEVAFPAARLH